MSQLGGQIETIDAPAFLGVESKEEKARRLYEAQRLLDQKNREDYHAKVFPTPSGSYPLYDPNSAPRQYPAETEEAKTMREKKTREHYDNWESTYRQQSAQQSNNHASIFHSPPAPGDTHWPNGRKAYLQPLPANFNWRSHFANGKERKAGKHIKDDVVYDPRYADKARKKKLVDDTAPYSYRTHWINGMRRRTSLLPDKHPDTHDDNGRLHRPADWAFHTHFNNNKKRPDDKHLAPGTLYDPNYKKPGLSQVQPRPSQVRHDQVGEIARLKAENKKLTGQNKSLQKMLEDAKTKNANQIVTMTDMVSRRVQNELEKRSMSRAATPTTVKASSGAKGAGRPTLQPYKPPKREVAFPPVGNTRGGGRGGGGRGGGRGGALFDPKNFAGYDGSREQEDTRRIQTTFLPSP